MNKYRKIVTHIAILLLALCFSACIIIGALSYRITYPNIFNALGYVGCFICMPLVVLLCFWKNKIVRWYLLTAVILISLFSVAIYYLGIEKTDNNISKFFTEETSFFSTSRLLMPEQEVIVQAKSVKYFHKETVSQEYVYFSMEYSDADYAAVAEKFQQHYNDCLVRYSRYPNYYSSEGEFAFRGHLYCSSLGTFENQYYSVSYCNCADSNSITIIIIVDSNLASISPSDIIPSLDIP